jgi:hypothetical protein
MSRLFTYMQPEEIDSIIGPVCEIADLELSGDSMMDALIKAAQAIRDREGFLVIDEDF